MFCTSVRARKLLDEAPKRGRLEFGAGLVVKRHGASFA